MRSRWMLVLILGLSFGAMAQEEETTMKDENSALRLTAGAFSPLPLGEVRAQGWLARQLRIQADGLSGHLDEFWPDVRDSAWIGGTDEGWERMPYWLDGVVPLAYLLNDAALISKVEGHLNYILTHQQEDGWLGPQQSKSRSGRYKPRDPWPIFLIFKVFTQYQEATGDERVIPVMIEACRCLEKELAKRPLFDWNKMRWHDGVLSLHWLYERTGEAFLLSLAQTLHQQGYDWEKHFNDLPYKEKATKWMYENHVVNHTMALKTAGVLYRQTGEEKYRAAAHQAIAELDKYHGQVTGVCTGDENLAGKNPSQGTELCSVAEYMFSLEVLLASLGDVAFADRLERISFNAWPATFKPDMWAHQYDQQVNQVACCVGKDKIWTTNRADANIFGLEPHYGCCLANMHQGWPKLTAHLWMKSPDDGLAAVAYAPSSVKTLVNGKEVRVSLETSYPFEEGLRFTVESDGANTFPIYLRIPCPAKTARIEGISEGVGPIVAGEYLCIRRNWEGTTQFSLVLPMAVRVERRYQDAVTVLRGPIAYSLKIGERWEKLKGEEPHADWEVFPTTPWNYALRLDLDHLEKSVSFKEGRVSKDYPFSPDGAPIHATVSGKRLPSWRMEASNAAAPPPQSPVHSDAPLETLTLIPYGCTNLRITEFPLLD